MTEPNTPRKYLVCLDVQKEQGEAVAGVSASRQAFGGDSNVLLDRLSAHPEVGGYLFVREASGHALRDLALSPTQRAALHR